MENTTYDIVYPFPTPLGVELEKNVYATMRDGIKLIMDIYKPAQGDGPWPVIVAYSGYAKELFFESALPAFYCPNGYVTVQVQARGTGQSQGKYCLHGTKEAEDGYDVIEWIAEQSWCTGNVGMMGASYYGVNQWITAVLNPPSLKCIVPCPGATDDYRGVFFPGGVYSSAFGTGLMSFILQGAAWPGPVPGKEMPEDIVNQIFKYTQDGPFYDEHAGTRKRIGQIKAPVLSICPAANELHTLLHLKSYLNINSPKKLLISPWTGTYYQPFIFETIPINEYILRWFDYWLKGIDTGIMDEPEIAIYDNGTGKLRYENEYPLKRTQWKKFYLGAKSTDTEPWGSINEILADSNKTPDVYRGPAPPDKPEFVAYTTPSLKEDLVVRGPVSISFYASTTEKVLTDWSFFVKVGEMVPNGELLNPVTKAPQIKPEWTNAWTPRNVHLWSWGNLKAKYREVDPNLSKPGQPWHTFQNPADLKSDTVYEFQIELQPIFNTFKKGHKIWVQITGDDLAYSNWDSSSLYPRMPHPQFLKNKVSIYYDAEYPSHLLLPIIPDAPEIAPIGSPLSEVVPGAPKID